MPTVQNVKRFCGHTSFRDPIELPQYIVDWMLKTSCDHCRIQPRFKYTRSEQKAADKMHRLRAKDPNWGK